MFIFNFTCEIQIDLSCCVEVRWLASQHGVFYCTSRGFVLLASLGICTYLITMNNIIKQLEFIIITSTPSLKKYHTNFKPSFMAKLAFFHRFLFSTLESLVYSQFSEISLKEKGNMEYLCSLG